MNRTGLMKDVITISNSERNLFSPIFSNILHDLICSIVKFWFLFDASSSICLVVYVIVVYFFSRDQIVIFGSHE